MTGALDIEMCAQKRLGSELHEADEENLNSAMVNARDSYSARARRYGPSTARGVCLWTRARNPQGFRR